MRFFKKRANGASRGIVYICVIGCRVSRKIIYALTLLLNVHAYNQNYALAPVNANLGRPSGDHLNTDPRHCTVKGVSYFCVVFIYVLLVAG